MPCRCSASVICWAARRAGDGALANDPNCSQSSLTVSAESGGQSIHELVLPVRPSADPVERALVAVHGAGDALHAGPAHGRGQVVDEPGGAAEREP